MLQLLSRPCLCFAVRFAVSRRTSRCVWTRSGTGQKGAVVCNISLTPNMGASRDFWPALRVRPRYSARTRHDSSTVACGAVNENSVSLNSIVVFVPPGRAGVHLTAAIGHLRVSDGWRLMSPLQMSACFPYFYSRLGMSVHARPCPPDRTCDLHVLTRDFPFNSRSARSRIMQQKVVKTALVDEANQSTPIAYMETGRGVNAIDKVLIE